MFGDDYDPNPRPLVSKMGEHRRRLNGRPYVDLRPKPKPRVRVVGNALLEDVPADGVVMLLLGDPEPEIACAMTPDQARQLADALVKHAESVEAAGIPETDGEPS